MTSFEEAIDFEHLYLSMHKCRNGVMMYDSWKNHASKSNSYHLLKRMDIFYKSLWRN